MKLSVEIGRNKKQWRESHSGRLQVRGRIIILIKETIKAVGKKGKMK